ncbi:MAG: hypothetical protein WDM85_08125 [Caulobacteraceae bacterium]
MGIEYRQGGEAKTATAGGRRRSSAAARSTRLSCCKLSGVGPAGLLREHGIGVVADLPRRRREPAGPLRDHLHLTAEAGHGVGERADQGHALVGETLKYLFQRKGLLTLSAAHIAVFCKSRPTSPAPTSSSTSWPGDHGRAEAGRRTEDGAGGPARPHHRPVPGAPESRGTFRIKSADGSVYPSIVPTICPIRSTRRWPWPR